MDQGWLVFFFPGNFGIGQRHAWSALGFGLLGKANSFLVWGESVWQIFHHSQIVLVLVFLCVCVVCVPLFVLIGLDLFNPYHYHYCMGMNSD